MSAAQSPMTSLIAAVGTPLNVNQELDVAGFEAHLDDQWTNGMTGILVGGTMGAMQMLTDATYKNLVERAIDFSPDGAEVMIGAGDTSVARTSDRIELLNTKAVSGVVVLAPYFLKLSQPELIEYFKAVADISRHPLFLYDLPGLTGTRLELATVQRLAEYPNICGIKCSGDLGLTRQLIDSVPDDFRVIVAQADLVDVLLRHGVREQLDGVFSLAPAWTKEIVTAGRNDDWALAASRQQRLSALLRVLKHYGVFQAFSAIQNLRGIRGNFAPAPLRTLSASELSAIAAEPVVQELVSGLAPSPEEAAADAPAELQSAK